VGKICGTDKFSAWSEPVKEEENMREHGDWW